ncbi:MAG: NAD(P)/FAD-dependent oxidoreductase [Candidatus Binatia bacterium]
MEQRAVIIVGSGPAGAATALGIAARDSELAARTLLLDKAVHPRDKVCAGGVIPKGVARLAALAVSLDVPHVRVDAASVRVPGAARVLVSADDLCRVVRRREFDARLAWTARDRGVELREGERVTHLARDGRGIRVETAARAYWAPIVVGADGSGSLVRRALVGPSGAPIGRAVMCDVPVTETSWDGYAARRYDFDFTACARGLRGYRWVFPCVIDGVPHANVGVYALPPVEGTRLKAELTETLADVGAALRSWQAFPIHTYAPGAPVSAPGVVLVGDAAGVDPLMGEGISFSLEYGLLAADAIVAAHARDGRAFAGYARAVHRGPIGRKLRFLGRAARVFYGRAGGIAFHLAAASPRAQAVGLKWYNGVDGLDERPVLPLAARFLLGRAL